MERTLTRLDPWSLFQLVWPDRRNPHTGKRMCRFCGRDVPKERRVFYCSDACQIACESSLSWPLTRRRVWERDGRKCRRCGTPLLLHSLTTYDVIIQVAEIHHIEPAEDLWDLAVDVTKDIEPESLRRHLRAKAYAILFHHLDNLETLCPKPCHDQAHEEIAKRPPPWRRTLEQFLTVTNT